MSSYVIGFQDIDKNMLPMVGGKGANLGELSRMDGIRVPEGFCVTTEAFVRTIGENTQIRELLEQLALLSINDRAAIAELGAKLRSVIEETAIPQEIQEEIISYLKRFGEHNAYAIRSSATAEDLPTASFAGQQDTYLNIIGVKEILKHIGSCFASLYTDRAIIYRIQNGFDHRKVSLAVVVQRMVFSQSSGMMFTADPVSGNRKRIVIDAGFGLGEALVSGLVNADHYKVYHGKLVDQKISRKTAAIFAEKAGVTKLYELSLSMQEQPVLEEKQLLLLEQQGRKIENHFGCPQDIEWCYAEDTIYIVQSRSITTLYPIPYTEDGERHVFVSVGHQQMMTDPLKPLGLSIFRLNSFGPRYQAGGRLFVDVEPILRTAEGRENLMNTLGQSEPLIRDALMTVIDRGDYHKRSSIDEEEQKSDGGKKTLSLSGLRTQVVNDQAIVPGLIQSSQKSIEELKQKIKMKSKTELFEFILEDIRELKSSLSDPKSMNVYLAAMDASAWINEKMNLWLGEKNTADTLSQSVPYNITSQMGLELLDVADAIRPYPKVIAYLQQVEEENFLSDLETFDGGPVVREAIEAFLNKYGMRCAGEIDITKPRWSEKPTTLIPLLLSNVKNFEPKAAARKFEKGLQEASNKEKELLNRLKLLPEGEQKCKETKRMIDLVRSYIGYREYPKYVIVNRYYIYKQALLKEAARLVQDGIIHQTEDIYYLTFEELHELVRTNIADYETISRHKEEFEQFEKLTPPRVITSDGEIIAGKYNRDKLPDGSLAGLAVSSGLVEGRARVIRTMEDADLEAGDILITSFTDPSWTPLFVSIKGLVTEVGGLMTHGAVIAREYGLPAVVGIENATKLIKDGQRIRLNGTDGYIELLS